MRAAVLHEHGATPVAGDFAEPRAAARSVSSSTSPRRRSTTSTCTRRRAPSTPARRRCRRSSGPTASAGSQTGAASTSTSRSRPTARWPSARWCARTRCSRSRTGSATPRPRRSATPASARGWRSRGARGWRPGETVLVLGATGAVGGIAVQAAKLLGAGRVVAAARANERLPWRSSAAPTRSSSSTASTTSRPRCARPRAARSTSPSTRSGASPRGLRSRSRRAAPGTSRSARSPSVDITLPAPAVRSVSLDLCGFSVAHPPAEVRREGYARLTAHAARGDIAVDVERFGLERVGEAWERQRRAAGGPKLVVVPHGERSPST